MNFEPSPSNESATFAATKIGQSNDKVNLVEKHSIFSVFDLRWGHFVVGSSVYVDKYGCGDSILRLEDVRITNRIERSEFRAVVTDIPNDPDLFRNRDIFGAAICDSVFVQHAADGVFVVG